MYHVWYVIVSTSISCVVLKDFIAFVVRLQLFNRFEATNVLKHGRYLASSAIDMYLFTCESLPFSTCMGIEI